MSDKHQESLSSMRNAELGMRNYLEKHSFLKEAAELHQSIDNAVEFIKPLEFPTVEECQELVKEGLPLLQHEDLQKQVTDALLKLSPQVIESLGDFAQQMGGRVGPQDKEKFPITLERLIKWKIIDRLIPQDLKTSEVWDEWLKPYCPVCGRKAVLAQLRKQNEGRARYLKCGGCGTMWRWNRLGCTYCDNEDLYKMHILETEAEPEMRLDVCDECKSYIKTYNHEGEEYIYLQDWATLHFDLLAEEQGLHKVGSVLIE